MRHARPLPPALLLAALAGCRGEPAADLPTPGGPPVAPLAGAATRLAVDTVARGLAVPWGIAPTPDGRLLVTERAGRVRVVAGDSLLPEPLATVPVYADDPRVLPEAGLMGIALAPDWATSRRVYVLATMPVPGSVGPRSLGARVMGRLRDLVGARALAERTGLADLVLSFGDSAGGGAPLAHGAPPVGTDYYHAGGALVVGPDSALYASYGDAMRPDLAGSPIERTASVHRLARGARAPQAAVPFALGLRNVQGLAWHPRTGDLFAVEHGPTGMPQEGGRSGHDELNVLRAGHWYGWGARPLGIEAATPPVAEWPQAIAPAGLVVAPPDWGEDVLLVTGLRSGALHRLQLARTADGGWRVAGEERLLGGHGRLRALAVGADGAVYVGTSNRDGRGTPRAADDLLLRVRPVR